MADIKINEEFLAWLQGAGEYLKQFLTILNEFRKAQSEGIIDVPATTERGPKEYDWDEKPTINLPNPITNAEIDAYCEAMAEAQKKEEAIEFIKGFITGVLVAAA